MEVDGPADVKNELPTPPASDVGSPTSFSHCGSDSEPDSPMGEDTKVRTKNRVLYCVSKCKISQLPLNPLLTYDIYASLWSFIQQPSAATLEGSAAGGSAGGMLDRSRMALCTFTFLFLSLNPLAALLCSSGGSSAASAPASATHHAGRSVLGVDVAGKT